MDVLLKNLPGTRKEKIHRLKKAGVFIKMMKFENVDVIDALYSILLQNTKFYRTDFRYDVEKICKSYESKEYEDKRFIWLSRRCGTYCFKEKDVVCQHTFAAAALDYYEDDPEILLYAVEVTGCEEERIMGNLYQLDYQWYRNQIKIYRDIIGYEEQEILRKLRLQKEYDGQNQGVFSKHLQSLHLRFLNEKADCKARDISEDVLQQNLLRHCFIVPISKQVRSFMESRREICILRLGNGVVLKISKGENALGLSIFDIKGTGTHLYNCVKDREMDMHDAYVCSGFIQSIIDAIGRVLETKNHGDIFCV